VSDSDHFETESERSKTEAALTRKRIKSLEN